MKKNIFLIILTGLAVGLLNLALPIQPARADHLGAGRGAVLDIDSDDQEPQAWPDVAWNERCDKFLVVYERKRTDVDYNIYGRYVDGNGLGLGAGPFNITLNDRQQKNPAIAYNRNGGNFVVVWEDLRNGQWEIWAQRVGCNKDLIGDPIRITPNENVTHYQLNPDVVCGYDGCWVVWEDFRNGNWDIYAQKLTPVGGLDGENLQLTTNTSVQRNPAIAYNPDYTGCADLGSFMVVWNDSRNAAQGAGTDIYAQQLERRSLCGANLPVFVGSGDQRFPDIAYGTTNHQYQVVWEDTRNETSGDIYARMLTANGNTLGVSVALASQFGSNQQRPAAAYDAGFTNEFTTVWEDTRNVNRDIYNQRSSGAGALITTNAPVVTSSVSERYTAIAFGNIAHHYLVVWLDGVEGIKGRAIWR
jgi:hypothetical protein